MWTSLFRTLDCLTINSQNLKAYDIYSFVGDNPILEIDKGERSPFPYKMRFLPLDLEEEKKGNHGPSPPKKVRDP